MNLCLFNKWFKIPSCLWVPAFGSFTNFIPDRLNIRRHFYIATKVLFHGEAVRFAARLLIEKIFQTRFDNAFHKTRQSNNMKVEKNFFINLKDMKCHSTMQQKFRTALKPFLSTPCQLSKSSNTYPFYFLCLFYFMLTFFLFVLEIIALALRDLSEPPWFQIHHDLSVYWQMSLYQNATANCDTTGSINFSQNIISAGI